MINVCRQTMMVKRGRHCDNVVENYCGSIDNNNMS
jgi:hypothetical protein